jgi:hypothetical protein
LRKRESTTNREERFSATAHVAPFDSLRTTSNQPAISKKAEMLTG